MDAIDTTPYSLNIATHPGRHIPIGHTHLYVAQISMNGLIKIGITNNWQRRITELITHNPRVKGVFIPRVPYSSDRHEVLRVEQVTHWLLDEARVRGEWFDININIAIDAVDAAVRLVIDEWRAKAATTKAINEMIRFVA